MKNYQEKAEKIEYLLSQCIQVILPVKDILDSIRFEKSGNKKDRESDGFKVVSGLVEMCDEILKADVVKKLITSQEFNQCSNNGSPKKPDIPSSPLL